MGMKLQGEFIDCIFDATDQKESALYLLRLQAQVFQLQCSCPVE